MGMIIFEGGDGVGKTSFAEAVVWELESPHCNVELIHRGVPQQDIFDEYPLSVEDYRPLNSETQRHIVSDRFHLGNGVYPMIWRDLGPYGELGQAGFRWTELFLAARGVVVWLIDQTVEEAQRRAFERGEDLLARDDFGFVLERFREVADESMLCTRSVILPSLGTPEYKELVVAAVDEMIAASENAAFLNDFPGYIGSPFPHTLLVGDRRGGSGPWRSVAPFMPVATGSGTYLMEALPEDFWRGVGIANANEEDMGALFHALPADLQIVALGREASDKLMDLDINHGAVPHPQYARRFRAKDKQGYGELIRSAAETGEVNISWRT